MLSAYITHPDCLKHEMGPDHPECPERINAIADMLLVKGYRDFMVPYDAPQASLEQLARAHSEQYISDMVARSPQDGYVHVDPDTLMNSHTLNAALRSAGAAILATDLVMQGEVGSAFCNVRPPGHHAERAACMGFCFFNNVAVGIRHALDVYGVERVALVDFDVHHGNGSADILAGDDRVLMCSIYEKGLYPLTESDVPQSANMVHAGMAKRTGSAEFRALVDAQWMPALEAFQPQIIYISAGFDAHREDDMGNLGLVDADYEWVTQRLFDLAQKHAQGRIVSCLEGGYVMSPLARSAAAHVKVLIGAD